MQYNLRLKDLDSWHSENRIMIDEALRPRGKFWEQMQFEEKKAIYLASQKVAKSEGGTRGSMRPPQWKSPSPPNGRFFEPFRAYSHDPMTGKTEYIT